jgi:hypothetical protein
MATLPHDIADLYLAPVALAVDARIDELGRLDLDRLSYEVALESDTPDLSREFREQALIRTVGHLLDNHDWVLSWDARGLRLANGPHTVVLGVPQVFTDYLSGTEAA